MAVAITNTILSLAATKAGICTRSELLEAGVSSSTIERRRRGGLLRKVGDGIYLVSTMAGPLTPLYRATSAVDDSWLSRRSAAGELGFGTVATLAGSSTSAGLVHITTNHGASRSVEGVVVHETRLMLNEDKVEVAPGLWASSPARTIVDLAGEFRPSRLRRMIQEQVGADNPSAVELHACFESLDRKNVPGIEDLRRILVELFAADPVPASELEARVWAELDRHGISGFRRQFMPPWYDGRRGIVDFAHPQLQVVLEADGRRWHSTQEAMEDDRRRDRLAAANGWVTVRLGWAAITNRPSATMDELVAVLDARRRGMQPAA